MSKTDRCESRLRFSGRVLICELPAGHMAQHTANVSPGSLDRVHWKDDPH